MAASGRVLAIQRFSIEDGPGIRTTVFVKGCPLSCLWCSNPESQAPQPELGHRDRLCNGCGKCVPVCPSMAISLRNGKLLIDRPVCNNCGECISVCVTGALNMIGREETVPDVISEVQRDVTFYDESRGGLTVSGGEPMFQTTFVRALLAAARQQGIHTATDTCGYAVPHALERLLPVTDLLLFDLKLLNDAEHRRFTGVSNKPILRNLLRAASSNIEMVIRIPFIPGITAEDKNIRAIAEFVAGLPRPLPVHILPYHRAATVKYDMLDRTYHLPDVPPPKPEEIDRAVAIFEQQGVQCSKSPVM